MKNLKDYIGKNMIGFEYDNNERYANFLDNKQFVNKIGIIIKIVHNSNHYDAHFKVDFDGLTGYYPIELALSHILEINEEKLFNKIAKL